ncbi:MAG: branched-chain amino acid ABC transporter permease, partial [Myxococcaceae bacterium]
MDLLAQYVMNGVMLGLMYALVALGFTLFFGVLDVVQFAHGDVLTAGAFVGLASYAALGRAGVDAALPQLIVVVLAATVSMAL